MRILAVLPLVPHPPDQGDRLRAWDLIQALAAQGELTLCLIIREQLAPRDADVLRSVARSLLVCRLTKADIAFGVIRGMATGSPPAITAYWCRRCAGEVQRVGDEQWDLAVAMQLRAAPYVIPLNARIKALELTDSLSLYQRQLSWSPRTAARRLGLMGVARLERALSRHFDRVWISSERDADWCQSRLGRRPTVVPNGCRPMDKPVGGAATGPLLFVGNMRYPPNEDGVLWFIREVWPVVRSRHPEVRFRIVGRTTARVAAVARLPGVEVVGYVADIGQEFAAARALVNPVQWGTGTNRKVLDAWAHAVPVISSAAGIRGLAGADGVHVLVARRPADWADRVAWVYAQPEAATRLGQSGWRLAVDRYQTDQLWQRAVVDVTAAGNDHGPAE